MTYAPSVQIYPPGYKYGNPRAWMWTIDELEESGVGANGDDAVERMWIAWLKGEAAYHAKREKQAEDDADRDRWG